MLLSITAVDLSAYAKVSGDYEYQILKDGNAEITLYKGKATKLTIPSKLGKYEVTSIGDWSFSGNEDNNYGENIKSVVVPDTVKKIGKYAFYNLNLESITIGEKVELIDEKAFASCTKLKNVVIPDSVIEIGNYAFNYDYSIETIKIGSGLKTIGSFAFPSGVMNYNQLKSISVNDKNKYFSSEEGVLFNKHKTKLFFYPDNKNEKTYYVPTTVKSFGMNEDDYIFTTHHLENIIIPKKVESIEHTFFLAELKSVTVLNKNCKIGNDNFFDGESETKTVFKGLKNSTLQKYAKSNNYKFIEVVDAYNFKIDLPAANYTYNGKAQKPSVTVKDSKGKKIDAKNYTVKYTSNKKVGKATVTITFKGNYSGTVKKTFTIKPKSTSISKLTAGKKKFTVKWKKQSTQTSGYEIQYANNSKFTKNKKTVTVKSNKTTSKSISKLKAKKKYYVRIRTYKTVNGKKIYSAWSKAKAVTTKK